MKQDIYAIINAIDIANLKAQVKSLRCKCSKLYKAGDYDTACELGDKAESLSELARCVEQYRDVCARSFNESRYLFVHSWFSDEEEETKENIDRFDEQKKYYLGEIKRLLAV